METYGGFVLFLDQGDGDLLRLGVARGAFVVRRHHQVLEIVFFVRLRALWTACPRARLRLLLGGPAAELAEVPVLLPVGVDHLALGDGRLALARLQLDVAFGVGGDVFPQVAVCRVVLTHQFLSGFQGHGGRILGDERQFLHLSQLLGLLLSGGLGVQWSTHLRSFVRYSAGLSKAKKNAERTVLVTDWQTKEFEIGVEIILTGRKDP